MTNKHIICCYVLIHEQLLHTIVVRLDYKEKIFDFSIKKPKKINELSTTLNANSRNTYTTFVIFKF